MSSRLRLASYVSLADDMDAAIAAFMAYNKAKNLSPRTIEFYADRMRAFRVYIAENAPGLTPRMIDAAIVRDYLNNSRDTTSAATANHNLNVVRIFLQFLMDDGFLEENVARAVKKQRQSQKVIETLSLEQVEALLATCDKSFLGIRDRAIILLLLDTGIRAQECSMLELTDVSLSDNEILVVGKGDKERTVPFGLTTGQAMRSYLNRRGEIPNEKRAFVTQYGGALDRYRIRDLIKRRGQDAGISGVRCSPHTFRHTFAVQYLRNGGDVFSLQKLLGHTDLAMTRRYAELSRTDVREKHRLFSPADRLTVPKVGRKRMK